MLLPILLTLAFLVISVPVVAAPLRQRTQTPAAAPASGETATAPSSYDGALLALRDLEFDHQLGVVNDDDYTLLHEQLVAQAATELERAPHAGREATASAIEAAIRRRREQRPGPATRFCPQCGNAVDAGDRFCTGCGNSLR